MPVPSSINDLSTTAASNSPGGGETPADGDNYIRALSAFIAQLRDLLNGTSPITGDINGLGIGIARNKSATTTRTSAATLADDPHLLIPLTIGTWAIDGWLPITAVTSGGVGGMKASFAFTGTATGTWAAQGNMVGLSKQLQQSTLGSSVTIASGAASINPGSLDWLRLTGHVFVTVAGNLKFQWAQNASDTVGLSLLLGGWLNCVKVG